MWIIDTTCKLSCCEKNVFQDVGLALRTLLATVDETLPQLPASTHREVDTVFTNKHSLYVIKQFNDC